jgi:hypothetical protein
MLAPYEGKEVRAVAGKVILEPEEAPERIIEIVREREDAFRVGRVISIGREAAKELPDLRIGDRVLYAQGVACTTAVKDRHIVAHDTILCALDDGVSVVRALELLLKTSEAVVAAGTTEALGYYREAAAIARRALRPDPIDLEARYLGAPPTVQVGAGRGRAA